MTSQTECEHLFCRNVGTARITAPNLKPRQIVCADHLIEVLEWAKPHRYVGAVIVEAVGDPAHRATTQTVA